MSTDLNPDVWIKDLGLTVSLTRDEWNLVCQAMAAAKRGWTYDYDYADDLVDKIDKQI